MESHELVRRTIQGANHTGITPVYGWVKANMSAAITEAFGSVIAFEDHYRFDMSHIFGGPYAYDTPELNALRDAGAEITPEILLDLPLRDANQEQDYTDIKAELEIYRKQRGRFCYQQTPGIFEALNDVFGIENHLCHMAAEPELLAAVYQKQCAWNLQYIQNCIDLGIDMVHISDDWGAQNSLLFSPQAWREMIYPHHAAMVGLAHDNGVPASLHSDGNIASVLDGITDIGFDLIHPYQESAGLDYQVYLRKYQDKFAILGGLCIQTALGFGRTAELEGEIRRVFGLLQSKRWICCTTHFVQNHCSLEELTGAYDLVLELSGKK